MRDKTFGSQNRDISRLQSLTETEMVTWGPHVNVLGLSPLP